MGWAQLSETLPAPAQPQVLTSGWGVPRLGPHPLCPAAQPSLTASPQTEEFFDLIASSQSRRLDDQRASVGCLPGLRITHNNLGHLRGDGDPQEPGDEFFNMLMKCQVGLQPRRSQGAHQCPQPLRARGPLTEALCRPLGALAPASQPGSRGNTLGGLARSHVC